MRPAAPPACGQLSGKPSRPAVPPVPPAPALPERKPHRPAALGIDRRSGSENLPLLQRAVDCLHDRFPSRRRAAHLPPVAARWSAGLPPAGMKPRNACVAHRHHNGPAQLHRETGDRASSRPAPHSAPVRTARCASPRPMTVSSPPFLRRSPPASGSAPPPWQFPAADRRATDAPR